MKFVKTRENAYIYKYICKIPNFACKPRNTVKLFTYVADTCIYHSKEFSFDGTNCDFTNVDLKMKVLAQVHTLT